MASLASNDMPPYVSQDGQMGSPSPCSYRTCTSWPLSHSPPKTPQHQIPDHQPPGHQPPSVHSATCSQGSALPLSSSSSSPPTLTHLLSWPVWLASSVPSLPASHTTFPACLVSFMNSWATWVVFFPYPTIASAHFIALHFQPGTVSFS